VNRRPFERPPFGAALPQEELSMSNEFLGDRRKALEAEFFRRQEAALLARLRAEDQRRVERAALAAAASIRDEALLDQLVALGISADTLTALALVPLAEIAWADGKVEDTEKQAILVAARAAGLEETSGGHRLLESCLSEPPQANRTASRAPRRKWR